MDQSQHFLLLRVLPIRPLHWHSLSPCQIKVNRVRFVIKRVVHEQIWKRVCLLDRVNLDQKE